MRFRRLLVVVLFTAAILALLSTFRVAQVHGDSMLPTFHSGEMVFVNRLSTIRSKWHRGDVILVHSPDNEILIKRIYKLPGETLTVREAAAFAAVEILLDRTNNPLAPLSVPAGHILVLGDNRAVSDDSRSFGPLGEQQIIGRVIPFSALP